MALGSQTQRCGIVLAILSVAAVAQAVSSNAIEKRLMKDRPGRLTFADDALEFAPAKGKARRWPLSEIRLLELTTEGQVNITLYKDVRWKADRDERLEFQMKDFPDTAGLALRLKDRMGERFIARVPLAQGGTLWRGGAKLLRGWGGPEGEFVLDAAGWRFESSEKGQSISVEDRQTENISSAGDLRLSVAAKGDLGNYEFLLKTPLPAAVYEAWWARLNRPRGLDLIEMTKEQKR